MIFSDFIAQVFILDIVQIELMSIYEEIPLAIEVCDLICSIEVNFTSDS